MIYYLIERSPPEHITNFILITCARFCIIERIVLRIATDYNITYRFYRILRARFNSISLVLNIDCFILKSILCTNGGRIVARDAIFQIDTILREDEYSTEKLIKDESVKDDRVYRDHCNNLDTVSPS